MGMLFLIDVHDQDRLVEAMEELAFQVRLAFGEINAAFLAVMINKLDREYDPAHLSRARDLVNQTIEQVRLDIGPEHEVHWKLFDEPPQSGITGHGVQEVLDTIQQGIEDFHDRQKGIRKPSKAEQEKKDNPPAPLVVIKDPSDPVSRIEALRKEKFDFYDVNNGNKFLDAMYNGTLETWDHGDHLYAAFLFLRRVLADPANTTTPLQPVTKAVESFLTHLVAMLKSAPNGRFRNTSHLTLTTFWIHEVYIAMQHTPDRFREQDTFAHNSYRFFFLLEANHHLMNGKLWEDYYEKPELFSPKAKDSLVLPTKKALPIGLAEEYIKDTQATGFSATKVDDDMASRRLKRWAYATLQTVKATGGRRGLIVKNALSKLQSDTIRLRARDPRIEPYSETQAYFWIQMVHAGMEGVLRKDVDIDFGRVSYETFEILYPTAIAADDCWKEYYKEQDWKGVNGRMVFLTPTIKGKVLPNFVVIDELAGKRWKWTEAVGEVRVPGTEELVQRAGFISGWEPKKDQSPPYIPEEVAKKGEDDDEWVDVKDVTKKTAAVSIATPSTVSAPPPFKPSGPQTWSDHAQLIHTIFNQLPKERSEIDHSHLSKIAYNLINSTPHITQQSFWVRMIIEAYLDTYGDENVDPGKIELDGFLKKNLELCWEDLWLVYFRELTWKSVTADEVLLGTDRKQMRSIRGWREVLKDEHY